MLTSTSKLDGNNALLAGIPSVLKSQLKWMQHAAAKLTYRKKYDHVSLLFRKLHWLSITDRITFKVLLLTFKTKAQCISNICLHFITHPAIFVLHQIHSSSKSQEVSSKPMVTDPLVLIQQYNGTNFL